MFKKKERLPRECGKYEQLISNYLDALYRLSDMTEKVVVKREVISLYPEGADKKKAQKDYEESQQQLLCAIANFDGRRLEMIQFYEEGEHSLLLEEHHYKNPHQYQTSHSVIEDTYRNIISWK